MGPNVECSGCGEEFDLAEEGWIETGDGDVCPACAAEWEAEQEQEIVWQEEGLA